MKPPARPHFRRRKRERVAAGTATVWSNRGWARTTPLRHTLVDSRVMRAARDRQRRRNAQRLEHWTGGRL